MPQWYYSKDRQRRTGPIEASELKALALAGSLLPTDLVVAEGMTQWVPAAQVPGLFIGAPPGPIPSIPQGAVANPGAGPLTSPPVKAGHGLGTVVAAGALGVVGGVLAAEALGQTGSRSSGGSTTILNATAVNATLMQGLGSRAQPAGIAHAHHPPLGAGQHGGTPGQADDIVDALPATPDDGENIADALAVDDGQDAEVLDAAEVEDAGEEVQAAEEVESEADIVDVDSEDDVADAVNVADDEDSSEDGDPLQAATDTSDSDNPDSENDGLSNDADDDTELTESDPQGADDSYSGAGSDFSFTSDSDDES